VLEDIVTSAGLEPEHAFDFSWPLVYADEPTLRRALVAPAGIAVLVGPDHEDAVKDAIVAGLDRFRSPDGSYRLQSQYHYLIARAR
jgi:hypothetical protein